MGWGGASLLWLRGEEHSGDAQLPLALFHSLTHSLKHTHTHTPTLPRLEPSTFVLSAYFNTASYRLAKLLTT